MAPRAQAKRRRKKKKPRYPQGYDPSLPNGGLPAPDPERWVPKWQRAEYKKRRSSRARRWGAVGGEAGGGGVQYLQSCHAA